MKTFAAIAVLLSAAALAESVDLGVNVPDHSRKVGERRYRSSTDFDGTLKYYKKVYPSSHFPWKNVINQPGIKALHIANPSGKARWEGLNIYETGGEVRISIVVADDRGMRPPQK